MALLCIPKILKNESNSQPLTVSGSITNCCCVSQRYWKMKAIHNSRKNQSSKVNVVVYPKDTEKWKQFTTIITRKLNYRALLCIPKILKNESNSQLLTSVGNYYYRCCVSQRYWKMKAIHNLSFSNPQIRLVVVYPKDTEKWKQFTTAIQ